VKSSPKISKKSRFKCQKVHLPFLDGDLELSPFAQRKGEGRGNEKERKREGRGQEEMVANLPLPPSIGESGSASDWGQ